MSQFLEGILGRLTTLFDPQELGVAAEILATRRDLISLLQGGRPARLVSGWRWEVIGADLLAALQ